MPIPYQFYLGSELDEIQTETPFNYSVAEQAPHAS